MSVRSRLLQVKGRGVRVNIRIDNPCARCKKELCERIQGVLELGYKFGVSCGKCGAMHTATIVNTKEGYTLESKG